MQNSILEAITMKIVKKYLVDRSKAENFAKDLINQIEAHGGNPQNEEQTDKSIDIIVRRWVEKGY